ncbi:Tomoregulin-1 [Cricetulus griseus]|uniref:Myb/SANT-like DNA-binding domain-containing protein 3 n=1 Tax=Cricetulus griseus TaxID=10029 RepID=G3HJZ3_CRIGR|nr:Tomoregulin-1 [Cricetulus griseus]
MQNNEIIKPAKYFSELEKSILLALVEKYKYVLECKKSDARTIALKQRTWQALAHEYNSQPSVSLRDFKQLKKCWENIKARTKKIMAHERREKVKRSGSPLLSNHVLGKEKISNMLPEQLYFLQSPPEEEPEYHQDAAVQEEEGSGAEAHRKHSKCGPCKYKAECDEDAENVGPYEGVDFGHINVIELLHSLFDLVLVGLDVHNEHKGVVVFYLLHGWLTDTDDTSLLGKKDDGLQYRPDVKDAGDQREDVYIGSHMPCPENLNGYCIHGKCEFIYSTQKASCRCESGYTGQHCEKTDFSILYVVPSRQKLTHVLIAAIIGAVQIAIIVAIVMCITRKCPKNNRGRRQKQNLGHFTSDTSSRMV